MCQNLTHAVFADDNTIKICVKMLGDILHHFKFDLIRLTIHLKLSFEICIENICRTAKYKKQRIRKCSSKVRPSIKQK